MRTKRIWLGILTVGLSSCMSAAHADYLSQTEFLANGTAATALETAVTTFLFAGTNGVNPTPMEVQQIGSSVYNAAESYSNNSLGATNPTSTPQLDFVTKHKSTYCGSGLTIEQQNFQCSTPNSDAATAQLLEMGDIRLSVLLEPLAFTNNYQWWAAHDYIRNITMPFPTMVYANFISNPSTFNSNTSQEKAYATYMGNQALLSVARYALDEMFGMRLSGNYLNNPGSGTANSNSIMQIMENEATRRFGDTNYSGSSTSFLGSTSTTETDMIRDMAAMQAFQLWMEYQSYRQNERIAALLSAILANSAYQNMQGNVATISAGAGG